MRYKKGDRVSYQGEQEGRSLGVVWMTFPDTNEMYVLWDGEGYMICYLQG